jgi:hypothetical protein
MLLPLDTATHETWVVCILDLEPTRMPGRVGRQDGQQAGFVLPNRLA